jgi:hypothetical protein
MTVNADRVNVSSIPFFFGQNEGIRITAGSYIRLPVRVGGDGVCRG